MGLTQIDLRVEHGHEFAKQINSECYSIKELYWSFLRDYDVGAVKKCTINISDRYDEELNDYNNWRDAKGVYLKFDIAKYLKLDVLEKKKMLLDIIHDGMMKIADVEKWDCTPLLKSYNLCNEKNYLYQFEVGKLKTFPNRKFKIGLWCDWDIYNFQLFWILYDKNNVEIKRASFVQKKAHEGEFVYYLKYKWINNSTVFVEDKYKYGKAEKWELKIEDTL